MMRNIGFAKRVALGLSVAVLSATASAGVTVLGDIELPVSEEAIANKVASQVFHWDQLMDKEKALHELLIVNGLQYASADNWQSFKADSIAELERAIGEQIPGRPDLQRWHLENSDDVYYRALTYNGDYSTRAKGLPNRVVLAIDNQSGNIVMFEDWNNNRIDRIYEARKANTSAQVQQMPDASKQYISAELQKAEPFKNTPNEAIEHALVAAKVITSMYNSNIPIADKKAPFRAPYLWGRIEMSDDGRIEGSRQYVHAKESFPIDHDQFSGTLYNDLFEIENELGQQIPLREQQIQWLNTPDETYFILARNPYRVGVEYENMIFAWDASTHESFMTILWNPPE